MADLLAVQGVSSELVSHEFPCYAGNLQGKMTNSGRIGPRKPCKRLNSWGFLTKFPTQRNRELEARNRELTGNAN